MAFMVGLLIGLTVGWLGACLCIVAQTADKWR